MSDVFISYARSTAKQAQAAAAALKALGYSVWLDDELLAHHAYAHAIEEQLTAAKAALVIWSAEAVKSEWVLSEANRAREDRKLVQLTVDGARLPMPFDQTQCADLSGWAGDLNAAGWRKVASSIAELIGARAEAQAVAAPLALPGKPSIAVMPFANLSGDPEQEYFADGMVAEITTALTRIRSIFVIASGSTLSFKGKAVGPQEVARQLGVRFVLEGSVRKAANRVRIAVQLIDADDGAQLWADRFEDTLDDVFALQDSVALSVAGKIEPTIQLAEIQRATARPTENLGSYDLYLRAMRTYRTFARTDVLAAIELLDRALALDPDYGSALGLAAVLGFVVDRYGWADDPERNRERAIRRAHRAMRVAGDDAIVLCRAAMSADLLEHDHPAALALVDRAIDLNPGSSTVWSLSGAMRVWAGQTDLGIEHLERSMRLDPLGPARLTQLVNMAQARFQQGRFSEAAALYRESGQQIEGPIGSAVLAACYGHLGDRAAGVAALARYHSLTDQPLEAYARSTFGDPAHAKLFLDGIALAEGKVADDAAPAAAP